MTTTTSRPISVCPKCGTSKKSGKRSCCAPGGAWYKNCGSAGNAKAAYTWFEGVQACTQAFAGMLSNQAQAQSALLNQTNRTNQTAIDKNLDPVQHQRIISSTASAHDAAISIPTYYDRMFNIVDFIFLIIVLWIKMCCLTDWIGSIWIQHMWYMMDWVDWSVFSNNWFQHEVIV